jgi:hypothetical protein
MGFSVKSDSVRLAFNGRSYFDFDHSPRYLDLPFANRPTIFTQDECERLYGLIRPFRGAQRIAHVCEDVMNYYENLKPTGKFDGTIRAMRGDKDKTLVFYVTKQKEPSTASYYIGAVFGSRYTQRVDFGTHDFPKVLKVLHNHMRSAQIDGVRTFPEAPINLVPQG